MSENHSPLWALSPLDGRYEKKTSMLRRYFSEGAYLWYRVRVEVQWFRHLMKILGHAVTSQQEKFLHDLLSQPSHPLIERIKKIEENCSIFAKHSRVFI